MGRDARAKIRLLDSFTAQFPNSTLQPFVYKEYYQAHFSLHQFSRAVAYADNLLELGDKIRPDPGAYETPEAAANSVVELRLTGFADQASAYIIGCDEKELQTPEASSKAKESAEQGLRLLAQEPEFTGFSENRVAAMKGDIQRVLVSEQMMAESASM